jgi:hypothetical protein
MRFAPIAHRLRLLRDPDRACSATRSAATHAHITVSAASTGSTGDARDENRRGPPRSRACVRDECCLLAGGIEAGGHERGDVVGVRGGPRWKVRV